jgi:hypothetical protein
MHTSALLYIFFVLNLFIEHLKVKNIYLKLVSIFLLQNIYFFLTIVNNNQVKNHDSSQFIFWFMSKFNLSLKKIKSSSTPNYKKQQHHTHIFTTLESKIIFNN